LEPVLESTAKKARGFPYAVVAGDVPGEVIGAGAGRAGRLALRISQTVNPATTPAASPAIPNGIHGIAASMSMRVDVWDGAFGKLMFVDESSKARSRVRFMSRVTVTAIGPVAV
jgi:hypothetical protein